MTAAGARAESLPTQPQGTTPEAQSALGSAAPQASALQTSASVPANPPLVGASIRVQGTTTAQQPPGATASQQPPAATDGARNPAPSSVAGAASYAKPVLSALGDNGIAATAQKLNPLMMRALKQFVVAKASFTGFCEDWHRKLAQREVDNLAHITWKKLQNGLESGSYVGYGPIESCTCKQASNGVPIGELTYKELDATLTGKTIDEARRAKPAVTEVPTREIFSWDKGKWFY